MRVYPGTIARMAVAHDQIHQVPFTHYLDLAAAIVVVVIIAGCVIVVALLKGLERHCTVSAPVRAIPAAKPVPVPGPRLPDPLNAWTDPSRDTPFAGTSYWGTPGPEAEPTPVTAVAAPEPVKVCEGPSCNNEVPASPWVCGTLGGDQDDEHEFCTRACLQEWVEAQKAAFQSAPRPRMSERIKQYW